MPSTFDDNREPVSKTYLSQGLELKYLDWGNEGAEPLFLLHGMWDHARSFDWVARALCGDWHVIVPDLRGHGDSAWSPDGAYLAPYYLMDFVDLVSALGFDDFSIIAHSYGGNPAARYAALYPDRIKSLVLIDAMGPTRLVQQHWEQEGPVKRTGDWIERRSRSEKAPRYFATVEDAASRLEKNNPLLAKDRAMHLAFHGVSRDKDGYRWKYDPAIGNLLPEEFSIDLAYYWRAITAPTLLCWGPESWTTNPATDGSAGCFQNVETISFERSGHWIHHDQLDEFIAAVSSFLGATSKT